MNDKTILELYLKGFLVDYITNLYYRYINRNISDNYFFDGNYIIKKKYAKEKCRGYVQNVIYNYLKEKK